MEMQLLKQLGSRQQNALVWLVILSSFLSFFACQNTDSKTDDNLFDDQRFDNVWLANEYVMQGTTQGTTFTIQFSDQKILVSPKEISLLLAGFDKELSSYLDGSFINRLNVSDSLVDLSQAPYFKDCFELSQEVFLSTKGAFDPSVFPLVKAWGFFKDMENTPTQSEIDSILKFTGFEEGKHYSYDGDYYQVITPGFKVDFNAIAQGQSVDVVADYIRNKGHKSFYIEIGGEIFVEGLNFENEPWVIGIDLPSEENTGFGKRNIENYLKISNKAVATSGNYRKFYEKDGIKRSHTLNPKNGYPVQHSLLSTTVIADNAAIADAYATAFMTMGVEETMEFLTDNPELNLEAYLLYENNEGRLERVLSKGMGNYLIN